MRFLISLCSTRMLTKQYSNWNGHESLKSQNQTCIKYHGERLRLNLLHNSWCYYWEYTQLAPSRGNLNSSSSWARIVKLAELVERDLSTSPNSLELRRMIHRESSNTSSASKSVSSEKVWFSWDRSSSPRKKQICLKSVLWYLEVLVLVSSSLRLRADCDAWE